MTRDALVTTQGLKMGSLRIRQRLQELEKTTIHYDKLVEEFIRNDLMSFQRLYLKDKDIRNVILMGVFHYRHDLPGGNGRQDHYKGRIYETL